MYKRHEEERIVLESCLHVVYLPTAVALKQSYLILFEGLIFRALPFFFFSAFHFPFPHTSERTQHMASTLKQLNCRVELAEVQGSPFVRRKFCVLVIVQSNL